MTNIMPTMYRFTLTNKGSGETIETKYPINLIRSPAGSFKPNCNCDLLIETVQKFEPLFIRFISDKEAFIQHIISMFQFADHPAYTFESKNVIIKIECYDRVILTNDWNILDKWRQETKIKCEELFVTNKSSLNINIIGEEIIPCHIDNINDANSFVPKILDIPNINNDIKVAILKSLTDKKTIETIKSKSIHVIKINDLSIVFAKIY